MMMNSSNQLMISNVQKLKSRKLDKTQCDINNEQQVIGVMKIYRGFKSIFRGKTNTGVLLVTGNYRTDINKTQQQQRKEFLDFKKTNKDQKGLRFFVLEFYDNNSTVIEEIQISGDIYLEQISSFFDHFNEWHQDGQLIDIYSYSQTINQAYHTFVYQTGSFGFYKNDPGSYVNRYIEKIQKYGEKMRILKEFDVNEKINELSNKCSSVKQHIEDCGHQIFLAVEFRRYCSQALRVWLILKDYQPFPLNLGQIDFLEQQFQNRRVQSIKILSVQSEIDDFWRDIQMGKRQQKFKNEKHQFEDILDYLINIEY